MRAISSIGLRYPRARNHGALIGQKVDASCANGRQRRQALPDGNLPSPLLVVETVASELQHHVWPADQNQLRRSLDGLLLDVGEHVVASGGIHHIVDESDAAARVNPPKRKWFAIEDDERARTRAPPDACAHGGYPGFDGAARRSRPRGHARRARQCL